MGREAIDLSSKIRKSRFTIPGETRRFQKTENQEKPKVFGSEKMEISWDFFLKLYVNLIIYFHSSLFKN